MFRGRGKKLDHFEAVAPSGQTSDVRCTVRHWIITAHEARPLAVIIGKHAAAPRHVGAIGECSYLFPWSAKWLAQSVHAY